MVAVAMKMVSARLAGVGFCTKSSSMMAVNVAHTKNGIEASR